MRRQNSHQFASVKRPVRPAGFLAAGALNIVQRLACDAVLGASACLQSKHPAFSTSYFGIIKRWNNDVDKIILGHTDLSDHSGIRICLFISITKDPLLAIGFPRNHDTAFPETNGIGRRADFSGDLSSSLRVIPS